MNPLYIAVPNADALLAASEYGAGALIDIERSTTGQLGAYTQIATLPLVSGQNFYPYDDGPGNTGDWYRTRYSNAGATIFSNYSASWQGGVQAALCDLENIRARLGYTALQHQDDGPLQRYNVAVSRTICNYTGRQFLPESFGDLVYLFDGYPPKVQAYGRVLQIKRGISSITTVEIAPATGYPYAVVNPVDYFLRPHPQERDMGWPPTKLVFTDVPTQTNPSLYIRIPTGHDVVRITGQLWWTSVPPEIEQLAENTVVRLWQARLANGSDQAGNSALGVVNITRAWSIDERKMLEEGYRDYAE